MRWALIAKRAALVFIVSTLLLAGAGISDVDQDGLPNYRERQVETQALSADTDGDGIQDGAEVEKYGSDPIVTDTDDDCLNDPVEIDGDTEVATKDTDGDGIFDGIERKATEKLPSADPTHKDVYVEVDYMQEYQLSEEVKNRIRHAFATAPVSNPDGERGIELHIVRDERVRYVEILNGTRTSFLKKERFDRQGDGYFYAVLVDRARDPFTDEIHTGLSSEERFLSTGAIGTELAQGSVFMHELGHTLGLKPARFDGIDTESVPFEDYPSVMNYNAPSEYIGYSNGSNSPNDHDDWEDVGDDVSHLNTSAIEAELGCSGYVDAR